jgi:hypothetical protein
MAAARLVIKSSSERWRLGATAVGALVPHCQARYAVAARPAERAPPVGDAALTASA